MSYNSEMQENNEGLQRILNAVNNLPNAGSDALFPVIIDYDTMKASHTPAEIAAARAVNKLVFANFYDMSVNLYSVGTAGASFSSMFDDGGPYFVTIEIDTSKNVHVVVDKVRTEPPVFNLTAMGLSPVSILGGETGLEYDLSDLTNALLAGPVIIKYNILDAQGNSCPMEGIVTGVASMDEEFVQIIAPGCVYSTGYRFMLCAEVYMDGMYVWTTGLGGTVIDTVDMGLTLTNILQSREMTEAAYEQLQAIVAAGPVRLRWQVNFGTESAPYLVDSHADLTPVTARSANGNYESITFTVPDGRYSYYISFLRDGSYYGVDYKIFTHEAT